MKVKPAIILRFSKNIEQFTAGIHKDENESQQWRTFCNFHLGNYKDALDEYQHLVQLDNSAMDKETLTINIAICMFYLGKWHSFPCKERVRLTDQFSRFSKHN